MNVDALLKLADEENPNLAELVTRWHQYKCGKDGRDVISRLRLIRRRKRYSVAALASSIVFFAIHRVFLSSDSWISFLSFLLFGAHLLILPLFLKDIMKERMDPYLNEFLEAIRIMDEECCPMGETSLEQSAANITQYLIREAYRVKKLQTMEWRRAEAIARRETLLSRIQLFSVLLSTSLDKDSFFNPKNASSVTKAPAAS